MIETLKIVCWKRNGEGFDWAREEMEGNSPPSIHLAAVILVRFSFPFDLSANKLDLPSGDSKFSGVPIPGGAFSIDPRVCSVVVLATPVRSQAVSGAFSLGPGVVTMATETKPSAGEDIKMDLFEDDDEFEEFEIGEDLKFLFLIKWGFLPHKKVSLSSDLFLCMYYKMLLLLQKCCSERRFSHFTMIVKTWYQSPLFPRLQSMSDLGSHGSNSALEHCMMADAISSLRGFQRERLE
ncbi:putative 26S proteasome complex subunit sem1-1 [Platanthera zijinensis]|uniref:26S proteasome complex subunit sem1-1 n=1 Tax=Platanthera zijinensis TaxID=2320716 RepID=A0AAP0BUC3_9ASPA